MGKLILLAIACCLSVPATAATTSADLDAIAKTLEQNQVSNTTLNSQLLNLLREPALTLDGVTLPSTAASYTKYLDTALKLRPRGGWYAGVVEHFPAASGGAACTASMSLWDQSPPVGLRMETFAWGKGNCPSVLSAAIARAWAYRLRLAGR